MASRPLAGSRARRPRLRRGGRTCSYLALAALALTMLFPFLWTLSASLKGDEAVLATPPQLLPAACTGTTTPPWARTSTSGGCFANSLGVALAVTALQLLTCSLAAYAFARMRFRGRQALFLVYIGTLMVPTQVTITPLFIWCGCWASPTPTPG